MIIPGILSIRYDASIALVKDVRLVFAVDEVEVRPRETRIDIFLEYNHLDFNSE